MLTEILFAFAVGGVADSLLAGLSTFLILRVFLWSNRNVTNFKGLPVSETLQHTMVILWARMDRWIHYLTSGKLYLYGASDLPRVVVEHFGNKSGRRFVTPLRKFNLKDYPAAGYADRVIIVAASNHGTSKLPAWYYNLNGMMQRNERVFVAFGQTIHRCRIEIVNVEEDNPRLYRTMKQEFIDFADYCTDALRHNRQLPVIVFRSEGEYSWRELRRLFGWQAMRPPLPVWPGVGRDSTRPAAGAPSERFEESQVALSATLPAAVHRRAHPASTATTRTEAEALTD